MTDHKPQGGRQIDRAVLTVLPISRRHFPAQLSKAQLREQLQQAFKNTADLPTYAHDKPAGEQGGSSA